MPGSSPAVSPPPPTADRVDRSGTATGAPADFDGRAGYRIDHIDRMDPFLMSVVSEGDLWMFLSSRGGLTCGRGDASHALFRYQTDDLLHDAHQTIGPYTRLHLMRDGHTQVWEPYTGTDPETRGTRSLWKSVLGNRVCFTERRDDLGLTFRYTWCNAQPFGWVREAELSLDEDAAPLDAEWLDGLRAVLPAGAHRTLIGDLHCLVNAYRRSEVDADTGLAVYPLQSLIMDQAEPGEALTANVAWCEGIDAPRVVLSEANRLRFTQQQALEPEHELKGKLAHYLLHQEATLKPGQTLRWRVVADVAVDQAGVVALRDKLRHPAALREELDTAIDTGDRELRRLIASADGLQLSADAAATEHHLANVMFNIMRGGVFADGHTIHRDDLREFLQTRHRPVAEKHSGTLDAWPDTLPVDDLLERARATADADLERLCLEYLPLYFGRRHGDPSRPWNQFSIRVRRPDGSRALDYQGNWRDIFQNWEALCLSFPSYLEPIVAKFVNATTADGFNPYRVSRAGIDWETPNPEHPWSSIGYWGDHQIIYLCKLIEWSRRFHPGELAGWLNRPIFSFADVPYRLKPYADMRRDPRQTIDFDAAAHRTAMQRVDRIGEDGRLLHDASGNIVHATLAEKLLIPVLAKLAHFVAGGGIWMNTQRPEWNDANNALVGNGVSMVTLCYLRRHLVELAELIESSDDATLSVSSSVSVWLDETAQAFEQHRGLLDQADVSPRERRKLLDALGLAFEHYRDAFNGGKRGEPTPVAREELIEKLRAFVPFLDHTIRLNRRGDGLYHAYNLLRFEGDDTAHVGHLDAMLEGQVAVLSAGLLEGTEVLGVIDALYDSPLYRPDQHSFTLYPDRRLPGFFERNRAPADGVDGSPLLRALLDAGDRRILTRDAEGAYRFAAPLHNGRELDAALDALEQDDAYAALVREHRQATLDLYEQTFNHHAFTGRSGGMYGYEGLGCIYWHMVSKLWLAVQENAQWARQRGETDAVVDALAERYHDVRRGLSAAKTPTQYGAFPTDPYSHTPGHAGAQQPGMTGQVKEEVLARFGELGVTIADGRLSFDPFLLRSDEFTAGAGPWSYVDAEGNEQTLDVPADALAFTIAQVPVVYRLSDAEQVSAEVVGTDGRPDGDGAILSAESSERVFRRDAGVQRIEVEVPRSRTR